MALQAGDGTWARKADMPTARIDLAVSIASGKIYAIGGYVDMGANVPDTSTVEEYDPVADRWTEKANMPTSRASLSACQVDDKIYAMGGYSNGQPIEFSTVEEYDPALDKWERKANMPTGRQFLSTCAVKGKIYAIGGWRSAEAISTTEEYDPVKDEWVKRANMPATRYGCSASVVNSKIYVIGGCPVGGFPLGKSLVSTVEEYDPLLDKWTKKADMPTARMFLATEAVNGKIYAIGGVSEEGRVSAVEECDPKLDKWTEKGDMPTARHRLSSSALNGRIYVIGGSSISGFSSIVEEYDLGWQGKSINIEGKLPTTWGYVRTALNK
jgi:N-acetylneuraminic acid mutarotase